jgi:hypothetical protein
MSRDASQTALGTPCHGTDESNPFFTMSKIMSATRERLANPVSSLGLPPRMPNALDKPGGARRDRTDDLLLAKQALSQLSYGPRARSCRVQASCQASERTFASLVRARDCGWWAWVDSNYRPHAYQACALTRLSYRPDPSSRGRVNAGAPKSNPGRKRNEDGETRQMGLREAPDFSIDASIARTKP